VCVLVVAVVFSEVGEVREDSWKDWVLKQLVEFGGRPCFAWSSVQEGITRPRGETDEDGIVLTRMEVGDGGD
jgi:hypothetical protein